MNSQQASQDSDASTSQATGAETPIRRSIHRSAAAALFALSVACVPFAGCSDNSAEESVEEVGDAAQETVEEAGDAIEDATDG